MSTLPENLQAPLTTDRIQKYLDENQQFILAIFENQNMGKIAEVAKYQVRLQQNMIYLAAIADFQPDPKPTLSQESSPPLQNPKISRKLRQSKESRRMDPLGIPSFPQQTFLERSGVFLSSEQNRKAPQVVKKSSREVRYWSPEEHTKFLEGLEKFGCRDLKSVANHVQTRTPTQVRSHLQKYLVRLQKTRQKEAEENSKVIPTGELSPTNQALQSCPSQNDISNSFPELPSPQKPEPRLTPILLSSF